MLFSVVYQVHLEKKIQVLIEVILEKNKKKNVFHEFILIKNQRKNNRITSNFFYNRLIGSISIEIHQYVKN